MIAGHFFLAFSLAAFLSYYVGYEAEAALEIGLFAALFALLPDIDIIYAFKEVAVLLASDTSIFVESFWNASGKVHRGFSHSLVTGLVSSAAFTFYHRNRSRYVAAMIGMAALAAGAFLGGFLVASLAVLYAAAGVLLSEAAVERVDERGFTGAVLVGLISHPFGDLFTGTPPGLLYPLTLELIESRLILVQDPVFNLLSIFLVELSCLVLALGVFSYVRGVDLSPEISPLSFMTVTFGASYFLIPEPSLSSSYQFVYGLTSLSLFAAVISVSRPEKLSVEEFFPFGLNFLIAALLGLFSYWAVYLAMAA